MIRFVKRIFHRGEVDCVETRKLSSAYLEEELPPQKYSAIQSHLARCAPCRAFIETLASTIGMLSRFPRVSPPSAFKKSIMDRIDREGLGRSG